MCSVQLVLLYVKLFQIISQQTYVRRSGYLQRCIISVQVFFAVFFSNPSELSRSAHVRRHADVARRMYGLDIADTADCR